MKKKLFTLLMVLCLSIGLLAVSASAAETASGTWGEDVSWVLTDDGVLTISGSGPMYEAEDGGYMDAPWYSYRDQITSIVIKDGVTYISFGAFFELKNAVSVSIPDSVAGIGVGAFNACSSLTSVVIPNGVPEVRDNTFTSCTALTSVTIPASVTSIGVSAFANCTALSEVRFLGDAPTFEIREISNRVTTMLFQPFDGTTTTCYYPEGNATWTADVMQNYGGTITWTPYSSFKINANPATVKVKAGSTAKFTVKVTGNGLKYQWQYKAPGGTWKNTTATGAKTATLKIPATTGRSAYQYRCVITDSNGDTLTSKAAYLYVLGIKTQPTVQKVKAGTTAKFTVAATGHNKTYQWQYKTPGGTWKNTTAAGAKTATLKVNATVAKSGYQYRCVIRDSAGNKVTSKAVYLYVLGIKTQPTNKTVSTGSTAKFTVSATGHNKTFQWQYRTSENGAWKNIGSGYSSLTISATARKDGYQYRCIITDSGGNKVISKIATLTVQ